MKVFDSLFPSGKVGAKRQMRAWQLLVNPVHYRLMNHALNRPPGTFSRGEKGNDVACIAGVAP